MYNSFGMSTEAMEPEEKTTRGRPTLKEKQFELRENMILDAAIDLLKEKGATLMTLDDVIGQVGISKPTFYLHFKSKEDLFVALMERTTRDATEQFRRISESLPPGEAVAQMIDWAIEMRFNPEGSCCFDINGVVSLLTHEPLLAEKQEMVEVVRATIERAQEEGTARIGISALFLALQMMSVFKDWTYDECIGSGQLTSSEIKEGLRRTIFI